MIKTIPKKKKYKKAKWLSEEALQIAEKRTEAEGKGEKERYTHLNAEFQRITRRDKKAFLSDQCKETKENNRMGKTRELFKKIRDTKGTFHAKMGIIKDRNGMDLTEATKILRRGGKNIQKNYTKKILMTQITMMCDHSPRARQECKVNWALESISTNKASGGDGIPAELFQILEDDAVLGMPANMEHSAVVTGLEKVSFYSNPKEGQGQRIFKLPHNCTHLTR